MAEYTIPKPYRDFYVTNPYIELKESNERLQSVVKSGYVATNHFEGAGNQVIMFDKEKHGFSLTNDNSRVNSWSVNLLDSNQWESGAINSDTGIGLSDDTRTRTINYYPVMPGAIYTFNLTATTANYQVAAAYFDANKRFLSFMAFADVPATLTIEGTQPYYVRFVLKTTDDAQIQPSIISTDITALSVSVSSYTAPSDVTVKVYPYQCSCLSAEDLEQGAIGPDGQEYAFNDYVRSCDYIPIKPNTLYTPYISLNESGWTTWFYLFDKNKSFISYTLNMASFMTNDSHAYMRIVMKKTGTITPENAYSVINHIGLREEKMIIPANDTRIVTMPPFTSLYIESNVPYHGHALDLAE